MQFISGGRVWTQLKICIDTDMQSNWQPAITQCHPVLSECFSRATLLEPWTSSTMLQTTTLPDFALCHSAQSTEYIQRKGMQLLPTLSSCASLSWLCKRWYLRSCSDWLTSWVCIDGSPPPPQLILTLCKYSLEWVSVIIFFFLWIVVT